MRAGSNREHHGPPRRHRVTVQWLVLITFLLFGPGLGGETPAAAQAEPAVFYIEKIHLETERLSPDIVLSESLLREGQEYSEADLREAVHRIHRLPFVLLAEFALEKGSERGRYDLVITVYETRRWFFQVGGNWLLDDQVTEFDPRLDNNLNFSGRIGSTVDDFRGLIGRRFAVGKRGLLFASFGAEEGAFALGYQHYNLFDRNVLLSVSIGGLEDIGNVQVGDSSWGGRAQLGIPIKGNHALRILYGYDEYNWDSFLFGDLKSRRREAELVWVFNSLDDPVVPREGVLVEGGFTWSGIDDSRFRIDLEGQPFLLDISDERQGVLAAARRHWPVGNRQSVSVGARGFYEDGEESNQVWETEASFGHQVFLLRRQEVGKWRELRLESRASWLQQEFSYPVDFPGLEDQIDSWRLRTGLLYRNGWGLYRFSIDYVDGDYR
jgi:hypothetical protein